MINNLERFTLVPLCLFQGFEDGLAFDLLQRWGVKSNRKVLYCTPF